MRLWTVTDIKIAKITSIGLEGIVQMHLTVDIHGTTIGQGQERLHENTSPRRWWRENRT